MPEGAAPRPDWKVIRTQIVRVAYGRLSLASTPSGADVFNGQLRVGRTPLDLPKVQAGAFDYEIRLPGYKSEHARGTLKEGQAMSFNLRLRATGSGFAFNAGRIFAAVGTLGAGALLNAFNEDYARMCAVISLVYLVGLVIIWFGPETKGKPLPE